MVLVFVCAPAHGFYRKISLWRDGNDPAVQRKIHTCSAPKQCDFQAAQIHRLHRQYPPILWATATIFELLLDDSSITANLATQESKTKWKKCFNGEELMGGDEVAHKKHGSDNDDRQNRNDQRYLTPREERAEYIDSEIPQAARYWGHRKKNTTNWWLARNEQIGNWNLPV